MRTSTRFRELIAQDGIIVRPSASDALSAKIIEAAGFKAVGISGYGVAATLLGKPDVGLVTLTENAMITGYICSAVDIPVMVDADTGYGNAINVMRTTEMMINAGAAGFFIEDQVEPKRCGHVAGKQIISMGEAVGKIRAADRVRKQLDPDVILMARTDARGVAGGSLEETIRRANAYVQAGADIIFPEGLLDTDEIERVVREVDAPISYNRTGVSPMLSAKELEQLGVKMVANAGGALRSAARGMWDYMHAFIAEDTEFLLRDNRRMQGHPLEDFHSFIGFPAIMQLEREFLPEDELSTKYDGAIGYRPDANGRQEVQIA